MILTKTPYRVSLFGGGTDYPEWYSREGGAVIGMAINKYCYVGVKHMPPGQELAPGVPLRFRVQYSKVDDCNFAAEIKHPAVRAAVQDLGLHQEALEFHCFGDLPGRSGLGGSSSFTVGLLLALYRLLPQKTVGMMIDAYTLAKLAIRLERDVIGEAVGVQDQLFAAYGGVNFFEFSGPMLSHTQVHLSSACTSHIEQSLYLVFSGTMRDAHVAAEEQIKRIPMNDGLLRDLRSLAIECHRRFQANNVAALSDLGQMLHEAWRAKRSLTKNISSPAIDQLYDHGMHCGAQGGKLLGAGGGGFMLFYVPEERQKNFEHAIGAPTVKFKVAERGARTIIEEQTHA